MRRRASPKTNNKSIQAEKPKLKDVEHLSGAYIRSLVRELSSSRSKGPMNPNPADEKVADGSAQSLTKLSESQNETHHRQQQPRQQNKQVRRRFHTSRPYQERLLNMAEARREIVAALKYHRATMQKASEKEEQKQQQHLILQQEVPSPPPPTCTEGSHLDKKFRTNTTSFDQFNTTCFPSSNFCWPYSVISPVPTLDSLDVILPKSSLGLNLNLRDFENFETTITCSNYSGPSLCFSSPTSSTTSITSSASSSSSFSCSSCVTASVAEVPSTSIGPTVVSDATSEPSAELFHPVMDDKEMEEIRSIGDWHDMEWNDRLNSVQSAWWCEFLNSVEMESQGGVELICYGEGDGLGLIDEVNGIPPWLTDPHHLDDRSKVGESLQDAILPSLDIGDIDVVDVEWL